LFEKKKKRKPLSVVTGEKGRNRRKGGKREEKNSSCRREKKGGKFREGKKAEVASPVAKKKERSVSGSACNDFSDQGGKKEREGEI